MKWEEFMYCKNCGNKINDTDKFCPYCGETIDYKSDDSNLDDDFDHNMDDDKFDSEYEDDGTEEEEGKKSTGKYLGMVVGVLILVFFIGFAGLKYLDHQGDKALQASIEKQEKDDAAKKKEKEERDAARQKNKEEEELKEKEREEEKEKNKLDTSGDYILPQSNTKYYSESEINALSAEQIFYARNEIYARHGRKFQMESLDQYFRSKKWYNPTVDPEEFDALGDTLFNDYEIQNRDALMRREQELNGN